MNLAEQKALRIADTRAKDRAAFLLDLLDRNQLQEMGFPHPGCDAMLAWHLKLLQGMAAAW